MMYLLASFGAGSVGVEIDGINYEINTEERTATVIQKDPRYEGNVIIPSSIMVEGTEYSVTRIENFAFERCIGLTSVTIPSSINSFGVGAFFCCSGLTSLTLSEGLTNIGEDTFRCCTGLTSVTIPSSVTTLESCVFADCSALTSVTIPNGVISIGGGAFADCPALTSVTIPSSVTRIDGGAFHNCTGLTSVHIKDLTAWCNIIFEEAYSNPLYYAHRLFLNEEEISELVVPSGVSKIGNYSFLGCMNLTSVLIPSSVNSIGNFAILFCLELADIYCYAEAVPTTGGGAFDDEAFENATLHVPASALEDYKATEPWSKFEKIVALDDQPTDYRPFIEEGKVWKVGSFGDSSNPDDENHAHLIKNFYFDGDTIVGGQRCKKMMCREEYDVNWHSYQYVGALYENNQRVYCALPNSDDFVLLYDFATDPNTEIAYYNTVTNQQTSGFIARRTVCEDSLYHGKVTTVNISLGPYSPQYVDLPVSSIYWREGVGYNGFYNSWDIRLLGGYYDLMQCTRDDEVLYFNPSLVDCVTPQDTEVKKNWLDFTHTVKTKPKAPRRGEAAASDEETVTGEYSIKELFVNFKTLTGPYTITVTDAAGQPIYNKVVQTSNVVALNTDISAYPKGSYTITVENEEEAYSAEFTISDEDGLTPQPPLFQRGGEAGAVYDLSGRRIADSSLVTRHSSLSKGIYILDGRKVVVR